MTVGHNHAVRRDAVIVYRQFECYCRKHKEKPYCLVWFLGVDGDNKHRSTDNVNACISKKRVQYDRKA